MVVSATLLLPIERDRVAYDDVSMAERQLRDLTYHPEQFVDSSDSVPSNLLAEKRQWIETPQTVENARRRCRAIQR